MKELSIFVDEAGVFGQYKVRDPYYILSFAFHHQEDDISLDLKLFKDNIAKQRYLYQNRSTKTCKEVNPWQKC